MIEKVERLSANSFTQGRVVWPDYAPEMHGVGIVHLGMGNFARAHLLAYTDKALSRHGGDWRVTGVSLRSTDIADQLNHQNGRYTLLTCGSETSAEVIGALNQVLAGANVAEQALKAMCDAQCRIVSLTVTEKAYGITSDGRLDVSHPVIAHDLSHIPKPKGVVGLISAALWHRYNQKKKPFTVLSCDNLSHNGAKLQQAVLEFATLVYKPDFVAWIAEHVCFPSTMVDRITPASTDKTFTMARELTGYQDLAAVETEPFHQWVIEDKFSDGRPAWEAMGAVFVDDVAPYERMKLRMLNGAHSMMAYCSGLSDKKYVRDVMADPLYRRVVRQYLNAAAATITGLDFDLASYSEALMTRFSNPAIAHATAQIAMDGSQKLPQRVTATAIDAQNRGSETRIFAFTLAVWLAFLKQKQLSDSFLSTDDPKAALLKDAIANKDKADELIHAVAEICPDILPSDLITGLFGEQLWQILSDILVQGVESAMIKIVDM